MSDALSPVQRRLDRSVFPITERRFFPECPWHRFYPEGVPRAIDFPALRVEQMLLLACEKFPDRTALRYFKANWSYQELRQRVKLVASNLYRYGIRPGDRVLLALPNCPEFVLLWFALHWIGAEVVPANPLYSTDELQHVAAECEVRAIAGLDLKLAPIVRLTRRYSLPLLIVCSLSPHLPRWMRYAYRFKLLMTRWGEIHRRTKVVKFKRLYQPEVYPIAEPLLEDPQRPAVLQPTGGTTGVPKLAVLSHANLQANVAQLHAWCGLEPGAESVLCVLPFFHIFGCTVAMLSPLAGGATLLLLPRFDIRRVWSVCRKWRPSVAPMVPFMFAALLEEMQRRRKPLEGLRLCFSGAAPLDADVHRQFEQRTGATIIEGYGLSEASPVTHSNPPGDTSRPGTIGVPLPGTLARLVDRETGCREVGPGEVGELCVRGPQVMQGYLNAPDETAAVIRDGWLHTGDMAVQDADGFFRIVDRKKDVVISGGLNVYPTEVEAVLLQHPDIAECAIFGRPHRLFGEQVAAAIVPKPGRQISEAGLRAFCEEHLARYKVPRTIEIHEQLPKNFLGKVRRAALRRAG